MTPRKSMRAAAIVAAMIVPAAAWAAQQQPAPQTPGTPQPVAQAAVTGCAQAHLMAVRTIEMTDRRLEAARQANSPAAMRAAMDDMQAALRQLRTEIAPCAALHPDAAAALAAPGSPPAAADPHAGHIMPATAQPPAVLAPAAPAADSNMPTAQLPTRPQDLACATKVDPETAPQAAYAGKTYYFCSAAERDRFVKAPAAYRPKP